MKTTRLKMVILFCVIVVGSMMGEGYNVSSQPYRYGGKELVTLENLNLSDFGARWLDSPSGKFTTMDPLCEQFTQYSPYIYCAGNPIKYIDPSGEAAIKVALSGLKYIKNLYKVYKKTGKLTKDNLKKAGLDEFVDIAGDIQTIFDGDASFLDKVATVADIVVGTEFNDKGQKQAVEALGITSKKTFDEVLEGTIKGAKTSGRSKIYNKSGGLQKATEDFDALSLKDVSEIQTKYGKGKVGKNDKGETIVFKTRKLRWKTNIGVTKR